MQTAHEIVRAFMAENKIDFVHFTAWFHDCGYPEEEANVYDSRYMQHLIDYVAERDSEV